MPFEKGNKIAKGGQKPGYRSWAGLFKDEMAKAPKGSTESAQVLVIKKLVELALEGESWAMRELLDRCMGKAVQAVDVTSNGQSLNAKIQFDASKVIDIGNEQVEALPEGGESEH